MSERDSARAVAQQILKAELRSADLVQTAFSRIKQHNPAINAVVTLDESRAMASAQNADESVSGVVDKPLYGVPITVKDAFATAGLRTTSSYAPLKNYVPDQDASVVARLKAAGAIIIGKTNLPELAGDPQCWSPLFGHTNNPWNTSLTSGGSSGGSAAAVAMGFSYLDPGSDIGGSIRIPASYCGVAGLKATENRIPRTGHIPHLPNGQRSVRHLLSFGLLARKVDDLRLGLEIMAGSDGYDTEVPPLGVSPARQIDRPLRIAWWDDFAGLPLCGRTQSALKRTVALLQEQGHVVERKCPPGFDFEQAWHAYGIVAGAEIGLGMPVMERTLLALAGKIIPTSQPVTKSFLRGLSFDMRRYNEALNQRELMISNLDAFLGDWDAWLCPVSPTTAYPHSRMGGLRKPPSIKVGERSLPYLEGTISMTIPFSLTGHPVVVLPSGLVDGLPVGLQWVGRRWGDESLLSVCEQVEASDCIAYPDPLRLYSTGR